mmetsp:Transcript_16393/g.40493  ORF Transcript_16393/g.40493 Transcript_16393/m.40493 type:complete len:221 (+) Transcript_16393:1475-2137(+)
MAKRRSLGPMVLIGGAAAGRAVWRSIDGAVETTTCCATSEDEVMLRKRTPSRVDVCHAVFERHEHQGTGKSAYDGEQNADDALPGRMVDLPDGVELENLQQRRPFLGAGEVPTDLARHADTEKPEGHQCEPDKRHVRRPNLHRKKVETDEEASQHCGEGDDCAAERHADVLNCCKRACHADRRQEPAQVSVVMQEHVGPRRRCTVISEKIVGACTSTCTC